MSQLETKQYVVEIVGDGSVVRGLQRIGQAGDKSDAQIKRFGKQAGQATANVKQLGAASQRTSGALSGLGNAGAVAMSRLSTATAAVAGAAAYMGIRFVQSGVMIAAERDAQIRGLGVLMGSIDAARAHFVDLQRAALLPGVSLGPALTMSNMLQAAGFSALQATDAIKGFGNALALMGSSPQMLTRIAVALSQMANSPRVMQEEINQIREALPNIGAVLDNVARSVGAASGRAEDLAEHFGSGRAAAEAIIAEMTRLAALKPAEDTMLNALNNLGQTYDNLRAAFGQGFIGADSRGPEALSQFASALDSLQPTLQAAGAALGDYARASAMAAAQATQMGGALGGLASIADSAALPAVRGLWEGLIDLGQQLQVRALGLDQTSEAMQNVKDAGFGMGQAIAQASATFDKLQTVAFNAGMGIQDQRDKLQTLIDQYRSGQLTTDQFAASVHNLAMQTEDAIVAHLKAADAQSDRAKAAKHAREEEEKLAAAQRKVEEAAKAEAEAHRQAAAAIAEKARQVALLTGQIQNLSRAMQENIDKAVREEAAMRASAAAAAASTVRGLFGTAPAPTAATAAHSARGVASSMFSGRTFGAQRAPARSAGSTWDAQLNAVETDRKAAEIRREQNEALARAGMTRTVREAETKLDEANQSLRDRLRRAEIALNEAKKAKDQAAADTATAAIARLQAQLEEQDRLGKLEIDRIREQEQAKLDARLKGIGAAADAEEDARRDRERKIKEDRRAEEQLNQRRAELAALSSKELAQRYLSDLEDLRRINARLREGGFAGGEEAALRGRFAELRAPWTDALQRRAQMAMRQVGQQDLTDSRLRLMGTTPEQFVNTYDDAMATLKQLRDALAVVADPLHRQALQKEAAEIDRLWSDGMKATAEAMRALLPGKRARLIMLQGRDDTRAGINQNALTSQVLGNAGLGLGGMLQQARLDSQSSEEQRLVGAIRAGGYDAGRRIAEAIRQALGDSVAGEVQKALDDAMGAAA